MDFSEVTVSSPEEDILSRGRENSKDIYKQIKHILHEDEQAILVGKTERQWNDITISNVIGRSRYYVTQSPQKISIRARRYLKYRPYARFLFWFFFRMVLPEGFEGFLTKKTYKNKRKGNKMRLLYYKSWSRGSTYRQASIMTYLFLGYHREVIIKKLGISSSTLSNDLEYAIEKLGRRTDTFSVEIYNIFTSDVYTPRREVVIRSKN